MKNIILILPLVVLVCVGIYYLYPRSQPFQANVSAPEISSSSQSASDLVASVPGWKTCDYPSFGFKFQYPSDWNVYVYSSSEGAGQYPNLSNCGGANGGRLDPRLTAAPSPKWSSAEGMQITFAVPALTYHSGAIKIISGQKSFVQPDGSIVVGGYDISFGSGTNTSTRDDILQSFELIPSGSSTNNWP